MIATRTTLLLSLILMLAGASVAQTSDERLDALERELQELREELKEATQATKAGTSLEAGWDNGFYIKSGKDFKLTWNSRVMADAIFFEPDHPTENFFRIRRARLAFKATLYKMFEGKVEADFGRGGASLQDGYVNIKLMDQFQIKGGQYKEPFGMEENTSSRFVNFVERSMPTDVHTPGYDIGFMAHGKVAGGIFSYYLGIFNGNGSNTNGDNGDDKDVALRLIVNPFKGNDSMFLKGLHIGGAFTWGRPNESVDGDNYDTQFGTDYFEFDNVDNDEGVLRWGLEFAWMIGPFSMRAEWMQTIIEDLQYGIKEEDFEIDGWYATLTYFITGEDATFGRPEVKSNFNPFAEEFGMGAFEVAARVSMVHTDVGIINDGFATGTDRATDLTLGVNWWMNSHVVLRANYIRTWWQKSIDVGGGEMRNDEDGVMLRLQLDF